MPETQSQHESNRRWQTGCRQGRRATPMEPAKAPKGFRWLHPTGPMFILSSRLLRV